MRNVTPAYVFAGHVFDVSLLAIDNVAAMARQDEQK